VRHRDSEKILDDFTVIRDMAQRPVTDSRIDVGIENRPVFRLVPSAMALRSSQVTAPHRCHVAAGAVRDAHRLGAS
jgi:hypothetical protein